LLSHDRVDTDELIMTQELIADMLGLRREGVTVAAGHLEETACECYRVVKEEFDRLLG
jgi:hypothetical protein